MIIAVEKRNGGFFKVDVDNEITRELIDQGNCRTFQGKKMFWVKDDGSHSKNIDEKEAAKAIAFFAAQEA